MKKSLKLTLVAVIGAMIFAGCGGNNEMLNFSIQKAMASDVAKEKLDPNIKFVFAKSSGQTVAKNLVANKKSNNVGRSAEVNCQRAFISALITLQNRAKEFGANKVVNLVSYYKRNEFKSPTEFQCANGNIMAGVALKGDIAK